MVVEWSHPWTAIIRGATASGKNEFCLRDRSTQHDADSDVDQCIIGTVPSKFRSKARYLLKRLKSAGDITWDSTSAAEIDDVRIRGGNILDLVDETLRNRKKQSPPRVIFSSQQYFVEHPFYESTLQINASGMR
ncbi:hypothetical protein QAD02_002759 [Eretmocerus hayati]|uniref:Uncharacterized protein n=1 Tax=Eretmocerus hayati TaxID=131215 RepID=A0ACC2NJT3_9HYME|nr:hypothetical protein QAD02_002759 [Eretmocerus hayati]